MNHAMVPEADAVTLASKRVPRDIDIDADHDESLRKYALAGWTVIFVFFGLFGTWALVAPLNGAVVSGPGAAPTGTVQFFKGRTLLGSGTLSDGAVTVKISKKMAKKLKMGKNKLTASYLGSANLLPSQDTFVVTVVKR